MSRFGLFLVLGLAATLAGGPARAWWFADDGTSWPVFDVHRYGGDVNRPAATPDRPYFHGDDAVPLGLRWRDVRAAEAEAAAADAAAAVAVEADVAVPLPRAAKPRRPRRHVVRHAPRLCVPAAVTAHR